MGLPSRADLDLAAQTTAAGWPATASQVQHLREQKLIPSSVVTRRGRGVTTSAYPKGTFELVVALRRAATEVRQLHRVAVLAWLRGAAVREEGLRSALEAVINETDYAATGSTGRGPDRAHRRRDEQPLPFGLDDDPDTVAVLAAAALKQVRGEVVPDDFALRAAAEKLAPMLKPLLAQVHLTLTGDDEELNATEAELAESFLAALTATPIDGTAGPMETGTAVSAAWVRKASRTELDEARDLTAAAVNALAIEPSDITAMVGAIVGALTMQAAIEATKTNQRHRENGARTH